jgi:hypothetical protein
MYNRRLKNNKASLAASQCDTGDSFMTMPAQDSDPFKRLRRQLN